MMSCVYVKHTCTVYLAFQIIMFLPLKWDHCTLVMYPLRDGTDRSLHGTLTAHAEPFRMYADIIPRSVNV